MTLYPLVPFRERYRSFFGPYLPFYVDSKDVGCRLLTSPCPIFSVSPDTRSFTLLLYPPICGIEQILDVICSVCGYRVPTYFVIRTTTCLVWTVYVSHKEQKDFIDVSFRRL